ncbi:MAG: iron donor protein CyaY [Sterolibacterium sp.]|jgi:CyaY protein|nr:iron donor protein CyaY [Sterolibacterium sp.]
MDDKEFNVRAEAMLAHIEAALEHCRADFDYELLPGGVIELEFAHAGGSKMVINRHLAAREIWVAAKSGGYHFRPEDALRWVGTRDGVELMACLARCMSEQAGEPVELRGD